MWTSERAVAEAAARSGGRAALASFRSADLRVDHKSDASPVTRADREAEACMRALIADAFPDDGWLGEETGTAPGRSGRRWVVDPVDGTRNFVQGIPLWATVVACEQETTSGWQVIAAAVGLPALGEWYQASLGGGAWCDGQRLRVSSCEQLNEACWCFESPTWFTDNGLGAAFEALVAQTRLQRGLCDAYAHMLVASGRCEVMVEPQLSRWDMAAPSLIVTEAGGAFTDLGGVPGIAGPGCISSNGLVHQSVLRLIATRSAS